MLLFITRFDKKVNRKFSLSVRFVTLSQKIQKKVNYFVLSLTGRIRRMAGIAFLAKPKNTPKIKAIAPYETTAFVSYFILLVKIYVLCVTVFS